MSLFEILKNAFLKDLDQYMVKTGVVGLLVWLLPRIWKFMIFFYKKWQEDRDEKIILESFYEMIRDIPDPTRVGFTDFQLQYNFFEEKFKNYRTKIKNRKRIKKLDQIEFDLQVIRHDLTYSNRNFTKTCEVLKRMKTYS